MSPRALLDLCSELIGQLLRAQAPADGVVSTFFRQHKALGPRERHTLAETGFAVLRFRPLFQHLAQNGAGPQERRLAMLAWAGSPDFLAAALHPPERDWLATAQAIDRQTLPENLRHCLPAWLADRLKAQLPEDDFWPLVESLNRPAGMDARVNVLRAKRQDVLDALAAAGMPATPTPFSPWGIRLDGKPAINRSASFLAGDLEVQDEGSQLLALLTGAGRGEMVVDFCAGAGGKTLALGAMMRSTGRLYAWDTAAHRLESLKPRLARSGLSNVHPSAIAHERDDRIKRLAGKIDRVLVDAPCSGLGTLRRNPDLKWRQSPQALAEMTVRQAAILSSAARLLRPGGRLVYATCSLLHEENEAVAEAFGQSPVGAAFEPLPVDALLAAAGVPQPETLCAGPYLRLWPHRHGTDGFFAACWQRR
ncbi:MAG: RsmB/NOP family class I SAM-dependent RNA methyltransferase [Rubrivivax sp.]